MIYVEWPQTVNKKFYAVSRSPKPNVKLTEFESGRTTGILQNTRFVFNVNCSLTLKCKNELPTFWKWYTESLGGCAGVFRCPTLKRTSDSSEYFRFKSDPEEDEGQLSKNLTLELEEVY